MTVSEFRAWLEGYGASFKGAPSEEQWGVVKAKLAAVFDPAPLAPLYPSITTPERYWWQSPVISSTKFLGSNH